MRSFLDYDSFMPNDWKKIYAKRLQCILNRCRDLLMRFSKPYINGNTHHILHEEKRVFNVTVFKYGNLHATQIEIFFSYGEVPSGRIISSTQALIVCEGSQKESEFVRFE